jgi:ribonuclease E
MLDIERQNNESDSGQSNINAGAQAAAPPESGSGTQAGEARSPRRRRSVTRPAGPPAPEVVEPAPPASPAAGTGSASHAGTGAAAADKAGADNAAADKAGADGSGEPAARPARRRTSRSKAAASPADAEQQQEDGGGLAASGGTAAAPAAAFQPPLVLFQPPDLTARVPVVPARPRPAAEAEDEAAEDDGSDEAGQGPARRRRRGGRGRGKVAGEPAAAEAGEEAEPDADDAEDDSGTSASGKRRRRRRRTSSGGDGESAPRVAPDDPPNTVTHVRTPREKAAADMSDVKAIKGSTRLEAKRQRRREGRESGRRRPPIITESEFLARREAVERVMVVRQTGDRTQIAVMEDGVLVEHYVDKASHQSYVGNVYLGKVQNVLPSMEAAFVDIGKGRNAVLYAGEVNFDASGLEGESKRIESALKSGQSILVQVTKDPIGHKGARLTSQVSLPGRYLVYVPGANMTGISRKLPDTERTRLKQILKQVMPENAGVIVRTAAEGASEEELSRDVARLSAQWEAIEKKAKTASAPDLLYSEPDLTLRVVRDIFNEDFTSLIIASDSEWDLVDEYVRYVAPHLSDRMQRWDDGKDVFAAYRIDEQLAKALERKVWLPSGGSLVIDHTEAMTVIDVNTGKFTGQGGGNLEQTVTRNNLEAAEEIVRQLRLRDLGGIIVIDFIDMVLESNRELVLRRLLECLARDRTKHQVAEVTSLGLVQMTRKRVGSGLLEAFSVSCEHCNGRGVVISLEPVDHTPARGRDDGHSHETPKPGPGRSRGGARQSGGSRPGGGQAVQAGHGDAAAGEDSAAGNSAEAGQDGAAETETPAAPRSRSRGSRSRSGRSGGSGQDAAAKDTTAPDTAAADTAATAAAGQDAAGRQDAAVSHAGPGQDGLAGDSTGQNGSSPADSGAASGGEPQAAARPGRSRSGRRRSGSGGGQELEAANS